MKALPTYFLISFLMLACAPNENRELPADDLTIIEAPVGDNASLPYLVTGEDGLLYFSWVEKQDSGWVELKYARLEGSTWTKPELIASGNDWFVNWADYPMIAVDKEGNMTAHYLAKSSSGTYSYDVNVLYKPSGGEWSSPLIPHNDGTPTEHGFVTMLPQNDGTFRLAWLDGRNTGGGEHGAEEGHGGRGAMTIRTAVLDMEGNLTEEAELDNRVCDCCQTTGAITAKGPMFAYRDRSEGEIRDIAYVSYSNSTWTAPQKINDDNWNIAGCPVNGPRMSVLGNTVATAWFTAGEGQPKVKIAFSNLDSFGNPFLIDESSPLGRVDVILLDDKTAMVSWLDNEGTPAIKYRVVKSDGTMTAPQTVSATSEARNSGFPQMTKAGDQVYFAWTNYQKGGESSIKMSVK